jgi:hypothetical protein
MLRKSGRQHEDPAAADLANVCAFLAPEPIPEELFTNAPSQLPEELVARVADPLAWRQTLAHLARQSLARVDQHGVQMHRLTQAILRDRLTCERAAATRACAETVLAASDPGDPPNPITWPRWAQLMPHLLTADLAATENPGLRQMACNTCWYLLARGDTRTAHDLASELRQQWRARHGDDDPYTLTVVDHFAWALGNMSRYADARGMDQDTLTRRRKVLGDDHPDTLRSSNNLAANLRRLGEAQAARDLDQDTLTRRRKVLGDDHPDTLVSANNLAADLRRLGELQAALDLDQDTLDRRRRVLGEDHPNTLMSANNVAEDLRMLGDLRAAFDLDEDTLNRKRRVLGDDHPSTLISAINFAEDLRELGQVQAARDLERMSRPS